MEEDDFLIVNNKKNQVQKNYFILNLNYCLIFSCFLAKTEVFGFFQKTSFLTDFDGYLSDFDEVLHEL